MSTTDAGSLGRGTLGRRLTARVVGLIATVAVLMGVLSTWWIWTTMQDALDRQVTDQARREFDAGRTPGSPRDYPHAGKPVGAVTVVVDRDGTVTATWVTDSARSPFENPPEGDVATLLQEAPDGRVRTVDLSTGSYRVFVGSQRPASDSVEPPAPRGQQPVLVATGLPMADIHTQIWQVVAAETALVVAAAAASTAVVRSVVRTSLRPLNQLADTARDVSRLELDRGDVALDVRVPLTDAPENEVTRLAQSFNVMLDHVDEALAARQTSETKLRQFVADASHELRNPLASIRGYAEVTRRERDELPPNTRFAMERIDAESGRMGALVEDMLLLARLDNQPVLEVAPVDLTELVLMAVSDARAAGPDHRWQLDLPDGPVVVPGDRHRLQQVVVNLLTNARTHTPAGSTVTATVRRDGTGAAVVVADDGPGIPAELQEQVFERFVRGDPARARQGGDGTSTGLGLAIARGVVAAHGGTIRLDSIPGDTRFALTLPGATP